MVHFSIDPEDCSRLWVEVEGDVNSELCIHLSAVMQIDGVAVQTNGERPVWVSRDLLRIEAGDINSDLEVGESTETNLQLVRRYQEEENGTTVTRMITQPPYYDDDSSDEWGYTVIYDPDILEVRLNGEILESLPRSEDGFDYWENSQYYDERKEKDNRYVLPLGTGPVTLTITKLSDGEGEHGVTLMGTRYCFGDENDEEKMWSPRAFANWNINETWQEEIDFWLEAEDGIDTLYSDGTLNMWLQTDGDELPSAQVQYTVGTWDEDAEDWDTVFPEENGYYSTNAEEKSITLNGEALYTALQGTDREEIRVLASVVKGDGSILGERDSWIQVREPWWECWHRQSWTMLPGWSENLTHYAEATIYNSENPYGGSADYEVLGVEVTEEEPAQEGESVVTVEKTYGEDADDYWWEYRAEGYGRAVLTVRYLDLGGVEQSYEFEVTVGSDYYEVKAWVEGKDHALPGETMVVHAQASHLRYEDGEEIVVDTDDPAQSNVLYTWEIVEGADVVSGEAVVQDPSDPKSGTVTIRDIEPEERGDFWHGITVKVHVYEGTDETGAPIERASSLVWMTAADSFTLLYPWSSDFRRDQGVGEEQEITPGIRYFDLDNGAGAYRPEEKIRFRWYYDEDVVEIRDKAADIVVGNEENGVYRGRAYADNSDYDYERTYTIIRKTNAQTEIQLSVDVWNEEFGEWETEYEGCHYWLDYLPYDMWFNTEQNYVYRDASNTYELETENLEEFRTEIIVGAWDYEQDTWYETFDEQSGCYTVTGNKITLNGARLFDALEGSGYTDVRIWAGAYNGTYLACETETWCELWDVIEDYDFESNRDMLPGWDGTVNRWFRAYMENSTYPDGWETQFEVIDVSVEQNEPWEEGETVVTVEKQYRNDDETSDDYWWYYRAESGGFARLTVTYLDQAYNEETYSFDLYVGSDVYGVDVWSEGSSRTQPGQSITLHAQANHSQMIYGEGRQEEVETDGVTYEWTLLSDHGFASIAADEADQRTATVTFRELEEGEEGIWQDVLVGVRIFEGIDEETGELIERAYNEIMLTVADQYTEIWLDGFDENQNPYTQQELEPEIRYYPGENGDSYAVGEQVRFRWYYDENAVQILDQDGMVVGNNDANGEYISRAYLDNDDNDTGRSYIITRTGDWDTDIELKADVQDEEGNWFEAESRFFHLNRRGFNIWFDMERDDLFSDGERELVLQMEEGIDSNVYTPEITVGTWNGDLDTWDTVFAPGDGYYRTETDNTFILNGEKIFEALQETGYDQIRIYAKISRTKDGEEEILTDTDAWIFVREAFEDYDREWDRSLLPGWDGIVNGWYNFRKENSEYPNGLTDLYRVTDVEVTANEPVESGEAVVTIEKQYPDNDETSEDYWWYYRAEAPGDAELTVSYLDAENNTQTYSFTRPMSSSA